MATGASPALPAIPGLAEVEPLTNDDVWALAALPARLVVLGGGAIGCELGQAFATLVSHVTVVEASARLLPEEDISAAAVVTDSMRSDGMEICLGRAVTEVQPETDGQVSCCSTTESRSPSTGSWLPWDEQRDPRSAAIDPSGHRTARHLHLAGGRCHRCQYAGSWLPRTSCGHLDA